MPLTHRTVRLGMLILTLLVALTACGGGGDDQGRFAFTLALTGLPDSNTVFGHYEIFVVENGVVKNAGKFIVLGTGPDALVTSPAGDRVYGSASRAIFGPSSTMIGDNFPFISDSSHIFITLEPEGDINLFPSCQVMLAGEIVGRSANMTTQGVPVTENFPCAQSDGNGGFFIGLADFSTAAGVFQMRSPTDDVSNGTNNDFAGVWFSQPSAGTISEDGQDLPGLVLPVLESGLVYEAWAVVNGVTRSMGTFTAPTGFDSDAMTALQRGPDSIGPPFPGGDFVVDFNPTNIIDPPVLDLTTTVNFPEGDYRAFISIEPDIDNDRDPFQLEILSAIIPSTAVDSENRTTGNVDLDSLFVNLPTGTATMGAANVVLTDLGLTELSPTPMSDRRGHFELWLSDGTTDMSAGPFLIEGTNVRSLVTGTILGDTTSATFDAVGTGIFTFPMPMTATSCFITVENEGDSDLIPSERVILQGNVMSGVASMTVAGDVVNGGFGLEDFSGVDGFFHLSTPSDNSFEAITNDHMGIQFRDTFQFFDQFAVGLNLPVLPLGWCYEGWVEDCFTGRTFSTGRFFDPSLPDSDQSTSRSEGVESKFALPGKDFVFPVAVAPRFAAQPGSITGVFVTVETSPDNQEGPSDLRVLDSQSFALTIDGASPIFIMQNVFPMSTALNAQMSFEIGD